MGQDENSAATQAQDREKETLILSNSPVTTCIKVRLRSLFDVEVSQTNGKTPGSFPVCRKPVVPDGPGRSPVKTFRAQSQSPGENNLRCVVSRAIHIPYLVIGSG
jgi:hypothetical protein